MSDLQIGKIEQLSDSASQKKFDMRVVVENPPKVEDLTDHNFNPKGFYENIDLSVTDYKVTMTPREKDIMRLAEYAHTVWSGWMDYLFNKSKFNEDGSVTIPAELVTRWLRQCVLNFDNLPETEKLSDIEEAQKIWNILHG